MKILLVCPKYRFEGYTPTGLASVASIAERLGHNVRIVDLNIEPLPKDNYDIIGLTGLSSWKDSIIKTSKLFHNSTVIVGGPWATIQPEEAIAHDSINYVFVGEGEDTFQEFLLKYPNIENVRGVYTKSGAGEPRPFIKDLDKLPFPSWHLLRLGMYKRVTIITSRGCPNNCVFCNAHLFVGKVWRKRSPESVISEIELLVNKYKVKRITIGDENATLIPERFEEICDLIVNKKLKAKFDAVQGIRLDTLNKRLLIKMKKAGFDEITIAPESGSERIVNEIIGKKFNLSEVEDIVKICREIGLVVNSFFVIGFPEETKEEIDQTLKFAEKIRKLGGGSCYVGNAIPIPKTRLYEEAKKKNALLYNGSKLDWIIEHRPREIHCLKSLSNEWKPEEIIKIIKKEELKNLKNVYFGSRKPIKMLKGFYKCMRYILKL